MKRLNATQLQLIPTFADKENGTINMIVETPRNTRHKFAFEPKFGVFRLHQTIAEGLEWPYDFGFVPQTLGDDGDPLDVLFLCDEPTFSGCLVEARVLGLIRLEKNKVRNDRIVSAAMRMDGIAQSTDRFSKIDDLPKAQLESICRFLVEYSADQGNTIEYKGIDTRKKALRAIENGRDLFKKRKR